MKIILMMATTVDGIIAKDKTQNADWTSPADKKAFVAQTKKSGAIIFGETTFLVMGAKPLPCRFNLVLTKNPEKFAERNQHGLLEFFSGTPQQIIQHLIDLGYQEAILGGGAGTNAKFLAAGLVDEILITIESKIFGQGLNFTEGIDLNLNLKLLSAKEIGDDAVQLHYQVVK